MEKTEKTNEVEEIKEWKLGQIATQTEPVAVSPEGVSYSVVEALIVVLNKIENIEKQIVPE